MDRRTFAACAIALFAASLAAEAQQTGKVYRIGFLATASASAQAFPSWDLPLRFTGLA